jgi:hypothetical protein
MTIKEKEKPLLIINIFFINKVSVICNQLIGYKTYALTLITCKENSIGSCDDS